MHLPETQRATLLLFELDHFALFVTAVSALSSCDELVVFHLQQIQGVAQLAGQRYSQWTMKAARKKRFQHKFNDVLDDVRVLFKKYMSNLK